MRAELNEQEEEEERRAIRWLQHEANENGLRIHNLQLGELQAMLKMNEEESFHRILKSLENKRCLRRSENTTLGLRLCPTPTQQRVLHKIRELTGLSGGRPPTLGEIGKALGMAASTVHHHVCQLETRGWIQRNRRERRSILVIDDSPFAYVLVDILGATGAGRRLAEQEKEDELVLSSDLLIGYDPDLVFALRVDGPSMADAGVLDGDIIIVYRRTDADGRIDAFDGEMVVAQLEDDSGPELTVRYYLRRGDRFWLVPRGPDPHSIRFDAGGARIVGVVIGLVRSHVQRLTLADLSDAQIDGLAPS
jgi:repressor LexA